ncbi:MAG: hypothetical protein V6Z89_13395 [Desulfobacter sp.]
MTYTALAVVWIIWCTVHSILITPWTTAFFRRIFKDRYRYFRLVYNSVAVISLIPVLAFSRGMAGETLFAWDGWLTLPWLVLWGVALFLSVQGYRAYDMGQVSGLRQAMTGPLPPSKSRLNTGGILGITRHPWYLAGLVFLWIRSRHIHLSMVVENLVLCLYLFIGMRLEERKLLMVFGNRYKDYQDRVSPLFPLKWMVALFQKQRQR